MIYLRRKMGQSTLEYVILITVVVAAVITIAIYIKRAVQGYGRERADGIGEQFSSGQGRDLTTTRGTTSVDTIVGGVSTTAWTRDDEIVDGTEHVGGYDAEWYPDQPAAP